MAKEVSATSRRWSTVLTTELALGMLVILGLPALQVGHLTTGLGIFVTSALLTALIGLPAVVLLRRLKTGQVIREEGPQAHLSKAGTPTMGGLYFLLVAAGVSLGASIWMQGSPSPATLAVLAVMVSYAFIGWLDDWQVIRQKSNRGLTPLQKLLGQGMIAIAFCGWLSTQGLATAVEMPGLGVIPLGGLFWFLAVFTLLGTNNAVNLTDGLDGLAAGTVAMVFVGMAFLPGGDPSLVVVCLALAGACVGFLAQNRHPAQVFMGDTGSLGLGGALAAIALLKGSLWALALMGAVFVVEAVSVLVQVSYFKYTKRRTGEGKRLLRMSPLHHHLELSGWSEIQVVGVFYGVTALLVGLGYGVTLLQLPPLFG